MLYFLKVMHNSKTGRHFVGPKSHWLLAVFSSYPNGAIFLNFNQILQYVHHSNPNFILILILILSLCLSFFKIEYCRKMVMRFIIFFPHEKT